MKPSYSWDVKPVSFSKICRLKPHKDEDINQAITHLKSAVARERDQHRRETLSLIGIELVKLNM